MPAPSLSFAQIQIQIQKIQIQKIQIKNECKLPKFADQPTVKGACPTSGHLIDILINYWFAFFHKYKKIQIQKIQIQKYK